MVLIIPLSLQNRDEITDLVSSEQQIQTITAARELWDLVPEEEGDDLNLFKINLLNVRSHGHPEVTDPQQLLDDTLNFVQGIVRRLGRDRSEGQN